MASLVIVAFQSSVLHASHRPSSHQKAYMRNKIYMFQHWITLLLLTDRALKEITSMEEIGNIQIHPTGGSVHILLHSIWQCNISDITIRILYQRDRSNYADHQFSNQSKMGTAIDFYGFIDSYHKMWCKEHQENRLCWFLKLILSLLSSLDTRYYTRITYIHISISTHVESTDICSSALRLLLALSGWQTFIELQVQDLTCWCLWLDKPLDPESNTDCQIDSWILNSRKACHKGSPTWSQRTSIWTSNSRLDHVPPGSYHALHIYQAY